MGRLRILIGPAALVTGLLVTVAGAYPRAITLRGPGRPMTPEKWVEAFWAAYSSGNYAALEALFTPYAQINGRPVAASIARLRNALRTREGIRVEPKGALRKTPLGDGFLVSANVVIGFRSSLNWRPYRLISSYTWTLVREAGGAAGLPHARPGPSRGGTALRQREGVDPVGNAG